MIAQYATFVMAAILIVAMALEVRTGRIPNWLTLLPVALFVAVAVSVADFSVLYPQLALGVGVFLFGLVLFAISGIGAGAVKLMAGLALFVPLDKALLTLAVFLAAFFVSSFIIVQVRKVIGSEESKWHMLSRGVLPMSIPIGIAGLSAFFLL